MTEMGVVLQVKEGFAQVRVGRNSACAQCGKCGMTEKQKHVDFFASDEIGVSVGDTVELDIPEGDSARLAFVAYFIPLLPALVLLFVALGLKWAEWVAIILFFVGMAAGFAVLAVIDKARKHKWMSTPIITKILREKTAGAAKQGTESVENKKEGENKND